MAIPVKIAFAGSTAFTSVYVRPVISLLSFKAKANRSNQYATALSNTTNPRSTDN